MLTHKSSRPTRKKKVIRRKRPRHSRWCRWIMIVLGLIGIVILFYGVIALLDGHSFYHNSYSKQGMTKTTATRLQFHQPVNILILGTDTGAFHRTWRYGRTDEIMMNTLNPAKHTMRVTSVPRDSLVWLNGHNAKINSAYEFKGAPFTQRYMGEFLHVPVDAYMLINLGGLAKLTKKVGGVRVDPPLSFKQNGLRVKKNHPVRLSGIDAVDYCQMRYQDPRGDYGRQMRQRQVLFQLIHQVTTVHNLVMHPTLAKDLSKYIKTNLSLTELANLALHYRGTRQDEISTHYQGYGKQVDGQDYEVLSNHEIHKKSKKINQLMKTDY